MELFCHAHAAQGLLLAAIELPHDFAKIGLGQRLPFGLNIGKNLLPPLGNLPDHTRTEFFGRLYHIISNNTGMLIKLLLQPQAVLC